MDDESFDDEEDPDPESYDLLGFEVIETDARGLSIDELRPDYEDLDMLEDYIDSASSHAVEEMTVSDEDDR